MSAASLWRSGARLSQPRSRWSLFATGAKSLSSRASGSAGREPQTPSFLSWEIERMKKAYEKYNEAPPKPFKVKRSGDLDMILTRRKGREDIQVTCKLVFDPRGGPPDGLYAEELEGGEDVVEQKVVVNVTMTVTKGINSGALEINVDCDRRGYAVNHIVYRENKHGSKHHQDHDDYFPIFWRIGPSLRSGFHNFLETRGLDEIFACWVHDQMDDKAFRERLRLMEKINAFVEHRS